MKKIRKCLCVVLTVVSLFLCGCGTAMHELTVEEEEIIIQSAAYYVAKHNIQQKDGMSNVIITEETESESESETESETEETTESTEIEASGNGSSSGVGETVQEGISLAQAIGHGSDLKVTFEGSYLANNYVEGSAYSVDAAAGNTFYVMKIRITNTSGSDVEVNNAALNPIFKLVSGSTSVKSEVTFLTADFSTYVGTISAGQSVDTILLFEMEESAAQSVSSPALRITINDETEKVKL